MHGNYYFVSDLDPEDIREEPGLLVEEFCRAVALDDNNWYVPYYVAAEDGFSSWLRDEGRCFTEPPEGEDPRSPSFQQLWEAAARVALVRSELFDIPPIRIGDFPAETEDERKVFSWDLEACRRGLEDVLAKVLIEAGKAAEERRLGLSQEKDDLPQILRKLSRAGDLLDSPVFPFVHSRRNPYDHAAFASPCVMAPQEATAILVLDIHT